MDLMQGCRTLDSVWDASTERDSLATYPPNKSGNKIGKHREGVFLFNFEPTITRGFRRFSKDSGNGEGWANLVEKTSHAINFTYEQISVICSSYYIYITFLQKTHLLDLDSIAQKLFVSLPQNVVAGLLGHFIFIFVSQQRERSELKRLELLFWQFQNMKQDVRKYSAH